LKFQEFSAGIGGIMNVLLLSGGFIVVFFNNIKMNESLTYHIFLVDDHFKKNNFIENSKLNSKNLQAEKFQLFSQVEYKHKKTTDKFDPNICKMIRNY